MTILVQVELPYERAKALAKFCRIVPFAVLEQYATDAHEAHEMFQALDSIRNELREQGVMP